MKKTSALLLLGTVAAFAQSVVAAVPDRAPLPIIFVHGNGDDAAKWVPTIWLFESNGYPADKLFAIRFTNPVAHTDDTVDEPFRSSTTDAAAELSSYVTRILIQTHSRQVVLVGSSRGGLTIRNYLQDGGGQHNVAAAILCGTPNHGVVVTDQAPNGEFDGGGRFLRALNGAYADGTEIVPGVRMMTLRSDKLDKFAQPTGIITGRPEAETGVSYAGPELKGATNIVLPGADHRELAFSRAAFERMFQFITGREPQTRDPAPEQRPILSGVITGFAGPAPTNQPLASVHLRIYAFGSRGHTATEHSVYETTTTSTGLWGPFSAEPNQEYEFDLEAEGRHVSYFLAPIPRSSSLLNLRFLPVPREEPPASAEASQVFLIARPEGYFTRDRDPVTISGEPAADEPSGLPIRDSFLVRLNKPVNMVEVKLRSENIMVRPSLYRSKNLSIAEFLW